MALFTRRKNYLGIDIGTNSIKVLEIEERGSSLYLTNYAEVKNEGKPDSQARYPFLKISQELLKELLLQVFKEAPFRARRGSIAIPIYSTFSVITEVPILEKKDLEEAVKYEAQKHIPVAISEMVLEWRLVEEIKEDSKLSKLKILLIGVPKELVDKYKSLARSINFILDSLEVEIFSLRRAIGDNGKSNLILIDIGGSNTNLSLFKQDILKKSTNIPFGGNDLTRMIITSFKLQDIKSAEELKHREGLEDPRIKDLFYPFFNSIANKIDEFLKEDKDLKTIYLSGGGSLLKGFDLMLKERFSNLTIEVLNPWKQIISDKLLENVIIRKKGSYAVACGLALKIKEVEF